MSKEDPFDMYSMIAGYPRQFEKGFRLAEGVLLPQDFSNIVVAGMGGSASSPDVTLKLLEEDIKIPVEVHRNYGLPQNVSDKTLFVAISFSGNTEETIDSVKLAYEQRAQIVIVASGGALEHFARERGLPFIQISESDTFQPRMAGGYNVGILTQLLINAGIVPATKRQEILSAAETLDAMYLPQLGKKFAKLLSGSVPLIYTADAYWPVARVSKIKINENAKMPCFWQVFPEVNHTEMMGFTKAGKNKFFALVLRDPESDPRINKRMEIFLKVVADYGVSGQIIDMPGSNKIERTFGTLMLMDWISYWLAIESGVDPTPVDMVEEFKAAMKQ